MRFRVSHLLFAMLVVALFAAKESSKATSDFITQVLFSMVSTSLLMHWFADKSKAWLLALPICIGIYAAWRGVLETEHFYIALPLGCVVGGLLARRNLATKLANQQDASANSSVGSNAQKIVGRRPTSP